MRKASLKVASLPGAGSEMSADTDFKFLSKSHERDLNYRPEIPRKVSKVRFELSHNSRIMSIIP